MATPQITNTKNNAVATAPAANPFQPTRHFLSPEQINNVYASGGVIMHKGRHVDSISKLPVEMRSVLLAPKTEDPEELQAQIDVMNVKLKQLKEAKGENSPEAK